MRFIHCSDIHLGRRPVGGIGEYSEKRYDDYFKAFHQIVSETIDRQADALFIAGDLFDRKELSPEVLARTEFELQRLADAGIPAAAVEGNHDNITPGKEHESWLIYLEQKKLLKRPYCTVSRSESDALVYHFQPVLIKGTAVYGLGYPGGMISDAVSAFASFLEEFDLKNVIALVHTAPADGDFLPGLLPYDIADLLRMRVKYLACGHFHSYSHYPEENPFLFVPGSSEYWDLAEKNGRKGMILFDTETGLHEFIPTSPRNKHEISIDLTEQENPAELVKAQLEEKNILQNEDIVIVEISADRTFKPDTNSVLKMIEEIYAPLRAEVHIRYRGVSRGGSSRREEGESLESVERRIISRWDSFGSETDAVHRTLQHLKDNLRTGSRELFRYNFDAFLNHMLEREKQC